MIEPIFELLFAVPAITIAAVILVVWLARRRAGRLRHAWLVGFCGLLVAADAEPLPLPEPDPGADVWGEATPRRHTLEFGAGGGSFQTCAGAREYGDLGAMYEYSTPIGPRTNAQVRVGSFGAWDGAPSGGVRALAGLEHRWFGAHLGVIAGDLRRESSVESPALPAAALRVGPRDMLFLEGELFDTSPAPLPGPMVALGLGIAFPALGNTWEPLTVRGGMSASGVYLAPSFPLGERGSLELRGAYGDPSTWGVNAVLRLHSAAE